jgi:hypothetical protein
MWEYKEVTSICQYERVVSLRICENGEIFRKLDTDASYPLYFTTFLNLTKTDGFEKQCETIKVLWCSGDDEL